jgi:hypothetical protein
VHVHLVWFGDYLPKEFLESTWAKWAPETPFVHVADVRGSGSGVAKYLCRQVVEYLLGQGHLARWSTSLGWRSPWARRGPRGSLASLRPSSPTGLAFVRSPWYQGHDGPLPVIYVEDGAFRSSASISELLRAIR